MLENESPSISNDRDLNDEFFSNEPMNKIYTITVDDEKKMTHNVIKVQSHPNSEV